jgi:hypothetical protein
MMDWHVLSNVEKPQGKGICHIRYLEELSYSESSKLTRKRKIKKRKDNGEESGAEGEKAREWREGKVRRASNGEQPLYELHGPGRLQE